MRRIAINRHTTHANLFWVGRVSECVLQDMSDLYQDLLLANRTKHEPGRQTTAQQLAFLGGFAQKYGKNILSGIQAVSSFKRGHYSTGFKNLAYAIPYWKENKYRPFRLRRKYYQDPYRFNRSRYRFYRRGYKRYRRKSYKYRKGYFKNKRSRLRYRYRSYY